MATDEEQIVQFQVIRFGEGAERIFALDGRGRIWQATISTPNEQPKWIRVSGPPKQQATA